MNLFIFCFNYNNNIYYGVLTAQDGREAREILEKRFNEYNISDFGIKGVKSKTYQEEICIAKQLNI
jgi:hypothetical protein